MTRRTLLGWLLSAATALTFGVRRLFGQSPRFTEDELSTLHELAAAVLPSSLGREGTDRAANRFVGWAQSYRAGVPMAHGYGIPRLRVTPALPLSRYGEQLRAMARGGRPDGDGGEAGEKSASEWKELARRSLREAGVSELPRRPDGTHVVSDLMSFYLHSSEARDLCYQAEIGRHRCMGLAGMEERPAPLRAASGRAR